ncbi:MAG: hypothetical protein J4F36_03745 [Nitrosopumilaceae archaeon]|nr:hypothetical protein [Nitrosopumilaceae archaeon]
MTLSCSHHPKVVRMNFRCRAEGDYSLELCKECYSLEDRVFLKNEEFLDD